MSLEYIGQQFTIYVSLFLIVTGTIGNGINIFIFSMNPIYRRTPCTFYYVITSIFNILYITINLSSRVATSGFGFDLARSSNSWCKIRPFCQTTLSSITLTCSCLATIDQFFVSSRNANIRRLSNIKWAYTIVFLVIIVWFTCGIPVLVFYNISSISNTCTTSNTMLITYTRFCILGWNCVIPVLTMILFGYLTYRNIQLTRVLAERHVDRQLVRMTLVQIMLIVICMVPYGFYNTYSLITSGMPKDANRGSIETFISTIISTLSYVYFTGSFYIFLISSSRFRQSIKDRILFWHRRNQVTPFYGHTLAISKTMLENKVS